MLSRLPALLLAGLLLAGLLAACDAASGTSEVAYVVSGTGGPFHITYIDPEGDRVQVEAASLSYDFTARSRQALYVSAQKGREGGTVVVRIVIDGRTAVEASSTDPYGVATASTPAP